MKLVRYGKPGKEKPGLIDAEGRLRDLSGVVPDIGPAQLAPKALAKLAKVKADKLPLVRGKPRFGVHEDRILVMRAHHSRVGKARDVEGHFVGHRLQLRNGQPASVAEAAGRAAPPLVIRRRRRRGAVADTSQRRPRRRCLRSEPATTTCARETRPRVRRRRPRPASRRQRSPATRRRR